MEIPIATLKLTLAEAATRQIEAAIAALERGHYDVAVTLAGAAEGMIKRDGPHMFVGLRDSPKARERFSKKVWISTLNLERDWLKHGGQDEMEIECAAAVWLIARAASKLEKWTPRMEQFKIWLMDNLDAV
ncbi:MAG: hypothetical protein ABI196_01340 [Bradyrhizobium sp.]